ncbi:MAG: acetyl-CoA C-acyltransferase, partial [Gammaproteobacteria bacterium]|nr:acetyl-CoA C-acyltransferase [Gammaproteobacteria bacterium]
MNEHVVILGARRTPIGAFQGALASMTAAQLGAVAARAAVADSGVAADALDEVILGCVLPAGQGQAPARQAAVGAGIGLNVPATTVNKMCGSGMKSVMLGADQIRAGSAGVILAGGIESMTNAPYMLMKARGGYRMGHGEILDHMFYDGLQSPWDGKAMGCFADATSAKYGFTRAEQDAFAAESVRRAQRAVKDGDFAAEIAPVVVKTRKGEQTVAQDETPFTLDLEKIPSLKPAFGKDGTVTAASSSSISDGAAAIVIASSAFATSKGLKPIARIVSYASHAQAPEWFTTAPGPSIRKALDRAGWKVSDVDLFEINEAFACVTMAATHDLGLDPAKGNVNGGACALGHP